HYRVKADAARAVRKIFTWSAQGLGTLRILGRLNREGPPPFTGSAQWTRPYLSKLLNSEALLGTYQPTKGSGNGHRTPDGEPVLNYFPAVIPERLWHAARSAMRARAKKTGRPAG